MAKDRTARLRRLAFIPPVLIGVLILAFVVRGRDGPQRQELSEQQTLVRAVPVQRVDAVPRAIGFGTVNPAKEWTAVAQVAGKIVELNPRLQRGAIVPEGTLLLRIDPTDYELALARAQADLASADAELASLEARAENLKSSREIETLSLSLSERDLERQRTLRERGTISDAALDDQRREVLQASQRVQELDNSLALIPTERNLLEAKQSLYAAQREQAWLDLTRTEIRAPFDLRLSETRIERTEFVRQGDILAVGEGIAVAEIEAQYPIGRILPLISSDMDLSGLSASELAELPGPFGLKASVRFQIGDVIAEWPAKVSRGSDAIDPRTRAFGVIVTVDEPIRNAKPGRRPPLVKGMLVEVELTGRARPDTLVLPNDALQQGDNGETLVYVVDIDNRLQRRPVTIGFAQDDFVSVIEGVTAGERVILSDPIPAIDGMLLEVVDDTAAAARVAARATAAP